MKIEVVDLEKLVSELKDWGLESDIEYDEHEEAYVVHTGPRIQYGRNMGLREVTIAPGFKHEGENGSRILAFVNQVQVHMTNDCTLNSSSRSRLIATSRTHRFLKENNDYIVIAGL